MTKLFSIMTILRIGGAILCGEVRGDTEVTGPTPGIVGLLAPNPIHRELNFELQQTGSLMFWFLPDRAYKAGETQKRETIPLISMGDLVDVSFKQEGEAINIFVKWDESLDTDRHIRIFLPEFPGDGWHHFALHWDADAGLINAFLDGSPFYWVNQQVSPWKNLPTKSIRLHANRFALADVQVFPSPFAPEDLKAIVGAQNLGRLDRLIGAEDLGALDVGPLRGEVLFEVSMADPAALEGWHLEGPGKIDFSDGWMHLESLRPHGPEGHVVLWCPQDFPDSFMAEWDFQLLSDDGLCIVFFAAKGLNGEDIFAPSLAKREGVFRQYINGDIASYHLSYYADAPLAPRRTTNLRKNPGLNLVSSGPAGVPPNSTAEHRVVLVKDGSRIRMSVDGKLIIDHDDKDGSFGPSLRDGKIGLRQMQWTSGRYRNFRVRRLSPSSSL